MGLIVKNLCIGNLKGTMKRNSILGYKQNIYCDHL